MMKLTKFCLALAALGGLAACDMIFDPGPPAPSSGPIFLFPMYAVRPALPICEQFDADFSRDHTATVTGATVNIASGTDVVANLPLVVPGVYRGEFIRSNLRFVVAYDEQHETRTLEITELTDGCRWIGQSRGPGVRWTPALKWPTATDWWRK
jgi:hypothetical protein